MCCILIVNTGLFSKSGFGVGCCECLDLQGFNVWNVDFPRSNQVLTEVSRVFLSVFHLEVEMQVVTLETTGNLHSSSLLAVQTTY